MPKARATRAASGRAGRAHHGSDCFLRGSRSADDRASFVLSIPAHRGFAGLATMACVTQWRVRNEGTKSHRRAEQGAEGSWFEPGLGSSAHSGLGSRGQHVNEASERGAAAKVFVVCLASCGSHPARDWHRWHRPAVRDRCGGASIKSSGRGKDKVFGHQRAFVGGWFDLQATQAGILGLTPQPADTRCAKRRPDERCEFFLKVGRGGI